MPIFISALNLASLNSYGATLKEPRKLFVLLGILAVFLYGMSVGKTKAIVSLLSIFVAYTLVRLFPFVDKLMAWIPLHMERYAYESILFVAVYCAVFLMLGTSSLRTRLSLGEISLTKVIIISIVQIGLLASIITSFVPEEISRRVIGVFYPYVAGQLILFFWSAAAVLILPFMRGHKE